jgi:hypothetical protein
MSEAKVSTHTQNAVLRFPPQYRLSYKWDYYSAPLYTGLSKKMDGIWNRYNLKSTGRIYTFGISKCSEKFKVLDLP